MSRELTSHDLHVACALCTARYYAEGAKWFGPHFADPAACCAQCNADAMKLLLVDAPPSERVPEIAEPWMIYAPSIRHVQRTYAKREDADAYCADLNRASSNPEWVVVDARIIAEAAEYCAALNRRES